MEHETETTDDEFRPVLEHQAMLIAYCERRGSRDAEGIAAETLSIAWKRRSHLKVNDCLPWLVATARNLLYEEYRSRGRDFPVDPSTLSEIDGRAEPAFEVDSLDPELDRALECLSSQDREAVLLVAWEELSAIQAAKSLGIRPATFRVRLHRARRRLRVALEGNSAASRPDLPIEETT